MVSNIEVGVEGVRRQPCNVYFPLGCHLFLEMVLFKSRHGPDDATDRRQGAKENVNKKVDAFKIRNSVPCPGGVCGVQAGATLG